MNILAICPCCSNRMIHYFHPHREAWFCRSCWQEMPNFSNFSTKHSIGINRIVSLPPRLVKRSKAVPV